MAIRIVGVDLPQNKRGEIALTSRFVRSLVLSTKWKVTSALKFN